MSDRVDTPRSGGVAGAFPLPDDAPFGVRFPPPTFPCPAMLRVAFDWFFRDRASGRVVIGQWPNLPLWLFGLGQAVAWIAGEASAVGRWAAVASWVALAVWAGDELARGVNPWRRCLGGAVLIGLAIRLVR